MHLIPSAEWAWVNQEMNKGVWPLLLPGNNEAGWAFNTSHLSCAPSYINALSADHLRRNPAFGSFDNRALLGPSGSSVAQNYYQRAKVLGDGIPALSRAMGRNEFSSFGGENFNMNLTILSTGWPDSRDDLRWLHSDLREVAYLYTHLVFDDACMSGGLK